MNTSEPQTGSAAAPQGNAAAGDPSMEDILASIRRILSEDEPPPALGGPDGGNPPQPVAEPAGSDVLVLDPAMMIADPVREAEPVPLLPPAVAPAPEPVEPVADKLAGIVAPEAAAAAASSLGSLVRTLAAERNMQVRSSGPTIEDLVRDELRALLKSWLDVNLAPLVERLVRAEIERVSRGR